jgi:broad specificity phosphatase PhoE
MGRKRTNFLVTDLRRQAERAKTVLAHVGQITVHVDDPYTTFALGELAQAVQNLEAAAAKFERRGQDYPERNREENWGNYGEAFRQAAARTRAREQALADGRTDGPDLLGFLLATAQVEGRLKG